MPSSLTISEFYRSIQQNISTPHTILLGAGASIESGIQSAEDCIWEWKRNIFIAANPASSKFYKNFRSEAVQDAIQAWLDQQGSYPHKGSVEEYSFYANKANPIPRDRQQYFQKLVTGKEPSLGYHILCYFAQIGMIKSVWTTNFDSLIVNACYKNNLTPIEISLDSKDRLLSVFTSVELPCIALHGDYKFGPMKNTEKELDCQEDIFKDALSRYIQGSNIIVLGYSGRDCSLMAVLKNALLSPAAGRLYWCGYGENPPPPVVQLISFLQENKKEAYYIATPGFDTTLFSLGQICANENESLAQKIEGLKKVEDDVLTNKVSFSIPTSDELGNLAKSNLFPFQYPQACFQFEIKRSEEENLKDVFNALPLNSSIVFAPGGGNIIYAWGLMNDINNIFGEKISTRIEQIPIPHPPAEIPSQFKNLITKSIIENLSILMQLPCNHKNRIWNPSDSFIFSAYGTKYRVFKAIDIKISFIGRDNFFSISPSFQLEKMVKVDKETKNEIARQFYLKIIGIPKKPNINFDNYINEWKQKIFGVQEKIKLEFPPHSGSGLFFTFGANQLLVGLNRRFIEKKMMRFPANFKPKQIVYRGLVIDEPKLGFYDTNQQKIITDFHPMRGICNHHPYDYPINQNLGRNKLELAVVCPPQYVGRVQRFLSCLDSMIKAESNIDYLIDYPGFSNIYKAQLILPQIKSSLWKEYRIPHEYPSLRNCRDLATEITHQIALINQETPKAVIVVFIPKELEPYTAIYDQTNSFNLHDFIKAFAVQNSIGTQLLREKTLIDNMQCQVMWWLSLALYVKALHTPWILTSMPLDTAFAGIGYGFNKGQKDNNIVLGCSHIYNSNGEGLRYKLSPIDGNKCLWDRHRNPFLSEEEAFKVGMGIRELFYSTSTTLPKRVVIHKRTRFTEDEITGFVSALKSKGVEELELLEINYEDSVRFVAMSPLTGNVDSFPMRRGTCFPINDHAAYLYTHGITSSVRNDNYKYFKGGTNIPIPIKIKRHYGSGALTQIASEILGLTKMNWNSFDLYSKLPCTLQSSAEIARIGWMLAHFEGRIYDYRFFM